MIDKHSSGMHAVSRDLLERLHGWLTHIHHYRADDMAELEAILAQPATAKVDERAEFEVWADSEGFCIDCKFFEEGNNFIDDDTRLAFDIWQARAKLNTPQ